MTTEPSWLRVFRFVEGLQETPGPNSNPVILNWNKMIGGPKWYDNDDKAWCALAVNAVLQACGLPMAAGAKTPSDPYDLLRARSFTTYGVSLTIPALGALMVFDRPEGAHVGLYLGERKDAYYVFGANQSNTIGKAWLQKSRLIATRWPDTVPLPDSPARIWLNSVGGPVSTNEA